VPFTSGQETARAGYLVSADLSPINTKPSCSSYAQARKRLRVCLREFAYLGHMNIQHTVKYTELAPHRFKGWSKD
jgi:hypothetical protein